MCSSYNGRFRFQRMFTDGMWFVTYDNHIITFGQYRHDLEQWIDDIYPYMGYIEKILLI